MKELVKELVEAYGPSGYEAQVRDLIAGMIRGSVDELRTDSLGNLIALKKGTGGGKRIMVAAHMDEIGLIVTYVDKKGFLRFGTVGGVFPIATIGSRVRFANGTIGVIGWEKWLRPSSERPTLEELFLDIGAVPGNQLPVGVGDVASFDRTFVDMGQRLVAKAMDDRIGCAIAVQTLLNLGTTPNDICFVFTTQEEVGLRGALVSAFGVEPEVGIAVDVTKTGDTPEAHPMAVELGGGPAIKVMDSDVLVHPGVKSWMMRTAEGLGITYQLEVLEAGGTDTAAMQRARGGIPAGCLSIPCRYIHTPSEMVDYGDVQSSVKLLVELLSGPVEI